MRRPIRTGMRLPTNSIPIQSTTVPLYIIERAFAEQLELTSDDVQPVEEINADEGVRWVFSFLSADRRHTYCLYEAPSADAIMAAAQRANIPADAVSKSNHRRSECRAARRPGQQRSLAHRRRTPL